MSAETEAVKFLLQALKETVIDHIDLKSGSSQELQKLKDELRLLEAFLEDSAKCYDKKEVFKETERKIRKLVYDVEDIIQICHTREAAAKAKNFITRNVKKLSTNMEQQVRSLRQERVQPIVDKITEEFGKIEIPDDPSSQSPAGTELQDDPLRQSSVTFYTQDHESNEHDKVVDIDDCNTIIEYLMEPKQELDVISITGMPGIGKTTLARMILQNEAIAGTFPLRIWINVSQEFNSRGVFLDILNRLAPEATSNPSEDELIATVRGCLSKEKFLLVMDDVWTVNDWQVIEEILPRNNKEGKVLVISRKKSVAARASFKSKMHELQSLASNKSWELLQLHAFGNLEDCPRELNDIGQAIASNCGGSPLIIAVVGGILKDHLAKKPGIPTLRNEWLKLSNNVSQILETMGEGKSILQAVELSYRRLPHELRRCFLYTGLFPDNLEIPTSTLTLLWIAEGFIRSKQGSTIEETAHKFLRDLINMNLLMVEKMRLDHVKSCRVHDTIREFCKAKAHEENLFAIVKTSEEGNMEPSLPDLRRLCLHSDLSKFLSGAPHGPSVRSFLCFLKQSFSLDPKHMSAIPDAFNLLRVLNCKSIIFGKFPKFKRLILLKHITLSIDKFDTVPKHICMLLNLQTLIVETNSPSITVKANIWKMKQLRRLKTKAAIFLDDKKWKGGEARENLQTVSRLSPESCTAAFSNRACNLKSLGIRGKLDKLFSTFTTLNDFLYLEKMKLLNHIVHESASNYPLAVLPQSDRFPPSLKRLTLSSTYLLWDQHMRVLANINTLEVLKLKDHAFKGSLWRAKGSGFESLEYLLIENSELVIWEAEASHFPSLRWLEIKKCEKLQKIPPELAAVANLAKLDIDSVRQSAAESARAIKSSKMETEEKGKKLEVGVPFKLNEGAECNLP